MYRPTLPPELIREIVQHTKTPHELVGLVSLSETWRREVERVLYRSLTLTKRNLKYQALTAAHLVTLIPRVGNIITSLDAGPIQKKCKNLKKILSSVPNLRALRIDFVYYHLGLPFAPYLPAEPPFSLRCFRSNNDGDKYLSSFLKTQKDLEELDIHAYRVKTNNFVAPEDLPRLRIFRSSHITFAAQMLRGHALTHLSFLGDESYSFATELNGERFPTVTSLALKSWGRAPAFALAFPNVRYLAIYIVSMHGLFILSHVLTSFQTRFSICVPDTDPFTKLHQILFIRPLVLPFGDEREPSSQDVATQYFSTNGNLGTILIMREQSDQYTKHHRNGMMVLLEIKDTSWKWVY